MMQATTARICQMEYAAAGMSPLDAIGGRVAAPAHAAGMLRGSAGSVVPPTYILTSSTTSKTASPPSASGTTRMPVKMPDPVAPAKRPVPPTIS